MRPVQARTPQQLPQEAAQMDEACTKQDTVESSPNILPDRRVIVVDLYYNAHIHSSDYCTMDSLLIHHLSSHDIISRSRTTGPAPATLVFH